MSEDGAKTYPLGKRYDGGTWFVDKAEFQAYAKATDDENPAYFGDDPVAPPMYHVRPFIDLMMKLATDPELELDILRLVHAGHDMRFHRLLKHGDSLELRAELEAVDEKSSGKLVRFGLFGLVEGELAIEGKTSYFIRGQAKKGDKKPAPKAEPPPTPDHAVVQKVTEDQATRYAYASGDENPIHLDPDTAKKAGLPGVILHGLCTMAFAQRDLVNELAGGDPSRLERLGVRFARPVFPGQSLTLKVWDKGDEVRFITENDDGKVVIADGISEIARA